MGCHVSAATATVTPSATIQPRQANGTRDNQSMKDEQSHLMYAQLFKELTNQIDENDRSRIISYCSDLYIEENLADSIEKNSELNTLTNFMREKIQDDDPICSIGHLMLEIGSYERAEYIYLKALSTQQDDWIRQASLLNNLGKVHQEQENYVKALEYYQKAVELQHRHLPEDHCSLSIDYSNIGSVYQKQNKYDLALEYFQRALNIEMNSAQKDDELVALFTNNIGLVYNDQKNFSQGLVYHEKSLEMNDKLLPSTHPTLALSHHNLAISLFFLGRLQQALEHAKKAVDITSQSLPNGHPQRDAHQDLMNNIQRKT
ncbi:unnamed protein product [Adineta ricciae]|uniref:Kinesin light chain n=1 Tax=Adineta ricciae TaxID=249248 RepID=A0A813Q6F6_ADIRI|nr:unnamed protein product [Adineta ricciae]